MRALTGSDPKTSLTEVIDTNSCIGSPSAIDRHNEISELQEFIRGNLLLAQKSHARFYNSGRRTPDFAVGQKVMLRTTNIRTLRLSKKLDVRFLGPFTILAEINKNAYRLGIPTSRRIHNVFHVSLLSHYRERMTGVEIETQSLPFQVVPDAPPQIEAILGTRSVGGEIHHLIKWMAKPDSDNSWEQRTTCELDDHYI